jgi:hypothetical protein
MGAFHLEKYSKRIITVDPAKKKPLGGGFYGFSK